MAGTTVLLCQFICTVLVITNVGGTPFLYNAPRAFITFLTEASGASSTPNEPNSNIADFTKLPTSEKLQLEPQEEDYKQKDKFSELDDLPEDDPIPPELTNEANPSFLSKKVNKLLSKLTLFARLSGPIAESPAPEDNSENLDDFFQDADEQPEVDSKNSTDTVAAGSNATEVEDMLNNLPALRILYQKNSDGGKSGAFGGYKYGKQGQDEDGDKEAVEINDGDFNAPNHKKKVIKKAALEEGRRDVDLSPQSIGVFFLELLATVMGLAYGAVAQFQNSGQNRP